MPHSALPPHPNSGEDAPLPPMPKAAPPRPPSDMDGVDAARGAGLLAVADLQLRRAVGRLGTLFDAEIAAQQQEAVEERLAGPL